MLFRYLCWARSLRSRTRSGDHWPVMNWGRAFGLATSCQRVRGRTVPERAADSWFQEPGLCPAPWGLRSADSTTFPFPRGGGRVKEDELPLPSVIGCRWLQVPSVPTDRETLWGRVRGALGAHICSSQGGKKSPATGSGQNRTSHTSCLLPPSLPFILLPFRPSFPPSSFLPSLPSILLSFLPLSNPRRIYVMWVVSKNLTGLFFFTSSHARRHTYIKFSIFSHGFEMTLLSHINLLYALGWISMLCILLNSLIYLYSSTTLFYVV